MGAETAGTVLIPAPRDGAEGVGGAAPGPQGRETGSTARRGACTAASGGGVSYYADVHRTKRNGGGFRITYTTDGESFRYADGFGDLPAGSGDRVYVDTIPLQHTDGVIELLRRGVEVYYLRRLTLIKKGREELRLSKTTRNDLRVLMSIEEKWFRRVTEDFLVMRRMILAHRSLHKAHQQLLNKSKALSGRERDVLRPAIESIEGQMEALAREISGEAAKRYTAYSRLVDELGIDGNTTAMEALAELITYIDSSRGFVRTASLVGLFRPVRGKKKIYSRSLRRALQRLTASVNGVTPFQLKAKLEKHTLYKVWRTCVEEAQGAGHTGQATGIKPGRPV